MRRSAKLYGLIVILGLLEGVSVSPALADPGRLVPVNSKICQSTNFYRVQTANGAALPAYGDRNYLVCAASTAQAAPNDQAVTNSPRSTVERFYTWYLANQNHSRERLSQQKDVFEPALYQQLMQAFRKRPEDGDFLDFDPFFNNQMGGKSYTIESVNLLSNAMAQVRLSITEPRGNEAGPPFTVVLRKHGDRWKISNLNYAQGANLLGILRDINKK